MVWHCNVMSKRASRRYFRLKSSCRNLRSRVWPARDRCVCPSSRASLVKAGSTWTSSQRSLLHLLVYNSIEHKHWIPWHCTILELLSWELNLRIYNYYAFSSLFFLKIVDTQLYWHCVHRSRAGHTLFLKFRHEIFHLNYFLFARLHTIQWVEQVTLRVSHYSLW